MKNKILNIFLDTKLEIDKEKISKYIDFCIDNNEEKLINGAMHHILPKAKNLPFNDYSNIKNNKWNGTYLTYANHYHAHHLLLQAIPNNYSILYSFINMNNCDFSNGRLNEEDLIGKIEYAKLLKDFSKKTSLRLTKWCNEEIILSDGKISTNAKERNKKTEFTRNKNVIVNGKITSIAKLSGIKQKETKEERGKWYILRNILLNDIVINERISAKEIRALSKTLHLKTKNNYMGYTREAKLNLNRHKKLNQLGLYVVEIK